MSQQIKDSLGPSFIKIDEFGFLELNEKRISDPAEAEPILRSLRFEDNRTLKALAPANSILPTGPEAELIVEAFDEPYIVEKVGVDSDRWWIQIPYGLTLFFDIRSLCLDEWDRFHGLAENGIPFVFNAEAQDIFFDLVNDFDDDHFIWKGEKIPTPNYWADREDLSKEAFWSHIYRTEPSPHWNLEEPARALREMLPRLKLPKSRILVLGCGEGHDAALFAGEGHLVTAVDISPEAITRAQKKYSHLEHLKFFEKDLFDLPKEWNGSFDMIFEHTCYCAINPAERGQLVKIWNRLLSPHGKLFGIFFAMDRRSGPPFGGSEWEIRKRLSKNFSYLFWARWRDSLPRRLGKELFVLAQKKS